MDSIPVKSWLVGGFGFLLATAYLPNTVGGALAPRFVIAAVIPWLLLGEPPRLDLRRSLPLAVFLVWTGLTAFITPAPLDAADRLLELFAASGAFLLGATVVAEPFYIGLGVGVPIAILYGGFNPNFDLGGEAAATAAVGLGALSNPLGIIPLVFVLFGYSKGAWLGTFAALCVGLRSRSWVYRLAAIGMGVALVLRIVFSSKASLWERWAIWQDTWAGTSILGNGLGSMWARFPFYATHQDVIQTAAVQHAHNDFLEILFEQGYIGGILALIAVFALLYGRMRTVEGVVLVAILAMGLVGFPLHMPFTMVVAAFTIGGLCRSSGIRGVSWPRGISFVALKSLWPTIAGYPGGPDRAWHYASLMVCAPWRSRGGATGGNAETNIPQGICHGS